MSKKISIIDKLGKIFDKLEKITPNLKLVC